MDFPSDFQPRQIVCLEHEGICLYAEVIQVVVSRQLCWVRPLLLGILTKSTQLSPWDGERTSTSDPISFDESMLLTDLRFEADLLWPLTLFRPALDTEVIPLMAMLPSLPQGNACGSSGTADEGEAATALPTDLEFDSRLRNGLLCDSSPQAGAHSAPGGNLREDVGVGATDPNVLLNFLEQSQSERDSTAARQLNQFIHQVWQTYKGAF